MTLTYVYCLVRSGRRPVLTRVPGRMPGARDLDALGAGSDLWLIVSHVPSSRYDETAVADGLRDLTWVGGHALAHEGVVERFLRARAVLPMQLFTLFTNDDRALAYVQQHRRRIDAALDRVERQIEWGVRFTLDDRTTAHEGAAPPAERSAGRRRTQRTSASPADESGVAYLQRKRDTRDADRRRAAAARQAGERVFRAMAREATASRRMAPPEGAPAGSRLLVDAAFLVPAGRSASFRAALRRHVPALEASGVAVSVTGPWPPYNFVQPPARPR